jgi:molybdate transport system substrate-binding protein
MCLQALAIAACAQPRQQELVVFAASSLREVSFSLEAGFEAVHREVDIVFHFAGSQELRAQLERGAEADVFAAADAQAMAPLVAAGRVGEAVVFARNSLVVVSRRPLARGLEGLAHVERLVVGAPESPIGRYSEVVLGRLAVGFGAAWRAEVERRIVSRESNVRQVLAKVRLGEADAALVYRTDARGGELQVTDLPSVQNVIADYPIAVANPTREARSFVAFVRGEAGRAALRDAGFEVPSWERRE